VFPGALVANAMAGSRSSKKKKRRIGKSPYSMIADDSSGLMKAGMNPKRRKTAFSSFIPQKLLPPGGAFPPCPFKSLRMYAAAMGGQANRRHSA